MNNSRVAIRYGDVAPEAKENFFPDTSDKASFVDLSELQQYNLNMPNYANPCELYSVVLDGEASAFPSAPEDANLGWWSDQISGDDGVFVEPIVLTLTSNGRYSSSGFTFTFDKYNQIYPTHLNIHWYRGSEDLGQVDFYPDNAFYSCLNRVESFDKVVITFTALNMPKNRLKLRVIDYGYGTYFYGDELRKVKLIQQIDPISSEIAINTADFTFDSNTDFDYSFQAKQPLSIYFNGELKATTFVKSAKRKSKTLWQIQSEDYIGLLDSVPFYGGIYVKKNAVELMSEIFTTAKVPFNISAVFSDEVVTGYIPYTTCREALMQVAFAVQAVVDTSNSESVEVYALDDEVKQLIPLKRIMQGQNFVDEDIVTSVEVTSHAYSPITEIMDAYKAEDDGVGENIFVTFSEPLYDLIITNGTIVSRGTNYAIINANTGCVLTGKKYEHTTSTHRKNNPNKLASDLEKVVAVNDATLVSVGNVDKVLQKCYNWLTNNNKVNLKIIEGKHDAEGGVVLYGTARYGEFLYGGLGRSTRAGELFDTPVNCGEVITTATEYLGDITGRIIKQTFNLNGGIIIKDTVMSQGV
jgi:hypothetical protein